MRRPRDHQGEPMLPFKRKASAEEQSIQQSRKKERSLSSCTSPRLSFLTRHTEFTWYEEDLWIEVAKCLEGRDLIRLAVTCRWFYSLIMEDSIWKFACLRDLQVLSPHHVSFKWFQLYASAFDGSHAYCFRQKEKHIDWMRIGAFFFETPSAVLTEKLALPTKLSELEEDHNRAIQLNGTCILTDIRTGIWIADLQLVRCPVCNLNTCEGTMQILDVRHFELFLEESFRNGSWQFEDIGSHRIEKQSQSASGGVFDYKHIYSPCTAGLLDTSGWLADPCDWQPRARLSPHAVAVNTNLQSNEGLHVRFQAMRSKGSDGKVVSIRISQQLI
ncbi:probable F-box protein At3g61730 [Phalaenopsis equestris]|uniref:probable F-box protein At3g61730 n=1 Tax=Phalaenopsis equestris TaxID=78828 RepID=UPI0009E5487B|nr:probable F-box protein At3g61730 [Phalaenopsis equestris]